MRRLWLYGGAGAAIVVIGAATLWLGAGGLRRAITPMFIPDVAASGVPPAALTATFDGADASREHISVQLRPVVAGQALPAH